MYIYIYIIVILRVDWLSLREHVRLDGVDRGIPVGGHDLGRMGYRRANRLTQG